MSNKKIAIIGSSNSVIKNGFHQFLKNNNYIVDVFSIGATTSLNGIYQVIKYDIPEKYDYAIIDFCISEDTALGQGCIQLEHLIAYFTGLLFLFVDKKCIPLVLTLSHKEYPKNQSLSYQYQRQLSDFFKIKVINISLIIDKHFKYTNNTYRKDDSSHYSPFFQHLISKAIISETNYGQNSRPIHPNLPKINFYISNKIDKIEYKNISLLKKETSIVKTNGYILTHQSSIIITSEKILCGIAYWSMTNCKYLYIKSEKYTLRKNLKLLWDGLFVRSIGNSKRTDVILKNKVELLTKNNFYDFDDITLFQSTKMSENIKSEIYISDLIFSDILLYIWKENTTYSYGI